MTITKQIAQVVREVARDCSIDVCLAQTPGDQDTGTDMVCCLIELSRAIEEMDYEEAKSIVLDDDNPARDQILSALALRGIYL